MLDHKRSSNDFIFNDIRKTTFSGKNYIKLEPDIKIINLN